jgi:uncharacterized membrane protein
LEVLTAVASSEHAPSRVATLRRHADLVLADAERTVPNRSDLNEVRIRYLRFETMRLHGAVTAIDVTRD